MKKRFFYSHPIIGGLIAMILVMMLCNAIGGIAMIGTAIVDCSEDIQAGLLPGVSPDDAAVLSEFRPYMDKELAQTVFNGTVALVALLFLPVFCRLNRKNGYRGLFNIQGRKINDVKIYIVIFVVLDIVAALVYLFTLPGGFPQLSISFGMIVLALYAGINEEIIDRAIPAAVMMRNKPTKRRILAMVLLTSVLFGAGHILNLFAGQDFLTTLIQIIFSAGAGLFFIGIYLRTGSITIAIAVHALHDFMVFMTKAVPIPETSLLVNDVLSLLINVIPFVFGILMLLPKHHATIIDTWTRIWPEKSISSAETVNG